MTFLYASLCSLVLWLLYGRLLSDVARGLAYNVRTRNPLGWSYNIFPSVGMWRRPAFGSALLRPLRWQCEINPYRGWRGGVAVALHVGPGAGYIGGRTFRIIYKAKRHNVPFYAARPKFAFVRGCNVPVYPEWW